MPKPMSSIRTIRTFGAPSGALTSKRGGALALRASSVVICGVIGSGIGSTVRSVGPTAVVAVAACCAATGAVVWSVSRVSVSISATAAVILFIGVLFQVAVGRHCAASGLSVKPSRCGIRAVSVSTEVDLLSWFSLRSSASATDARNSTFAPQRVP